MKVLVTGGTGVVGSVLVDRLVRQGFDVGIICNQPPGGDNGARYFSGDVANGESLRGLFAGYEAVVHLAAIANPSGRPGEMVINTNVCGTYNVFQAAAEAGIRRVIQASSMNTIGCAWATRDFRPDYFPIDEEYSGVATDPYSLSKQMTEQIGEYFWHRDGISSIAIRFPWVRDKDFFRDEKQSRRHANMLDRLTEFLDLSEGARASQLQVARRLALEFRANRFLEYDAGKVAGIPLAAEDRNHWLFQAYTFDRFNLWTYIDVRDTARAFEQALTAQFEGCHAVFANSDRNWLDFDTEILLGLFFPDVIQRKAPIAGSDSPVNTSRARLLFGFEPQHVISPQTAA